MIELLNTALPYLISVGMITYSSMLIGQANTIIVENTVCVNKAMEMQRFGIILLVIGIVVLLATINNRHPDVLKNLTLFAMKGGEHPMFKYFLMCVLLGICIYVMILIGEMDKLKCQMGPNAKILNISNYVMIGLLGAFVLYKGYLMFSKKDYK